MYSLDNKYMAEPDDVEMQRTQTIMEGASHCDFRFRFDPYGSAPNET